MVEQTEWQEDFDELAGKYEYEAGMSRKDAENKARKELNERGKIPNN